MTREEALKKVRQMSLPKETMEILESLAPELAESEDERIRKALIKLMTVAGERYVMSATGFEKEQLIAYLEKQKEQKPGEIPPYVTGIKGEPDPAGVWKPSEEQMEALNALNCHGALSYVGQQNQLISLYQDLKKLM